MRLKTLIAMTAFLMGMSQAAMASDVVVMRRSLVPISSDYSWIPEEWSECSNSCGSGTQIRGMQCSHNGKVGYADAYCTRIAAKPPTTQACTSIAGCSFTWQKGDWSDVAGCGDVVQTRKISCLRGDGTTVGNDLCPAPAPATAQTVKDVRTCSFEWNPGDWSPWSSECQTAATRTRSVTCLRSNGDTVDDASCASSGTKPDASETADRFGQCGYSWTAKAWSDWSSTCATDASRTRAVVCVRSNGDEVSDTFCSGAGAKPAVSDSTPQYSSCTYSWKPSDYGAVTPACGPSSMARTVECLRSNGDVVADTSCDASTKPVTSAAATDYSTCSYAWSEADWGAPSTTCGDATSLRVVICKSSDGRTVGDSSCSGVKPDQSKASHETSGCSFSWQSDQTWSVPVPACGATVQNRDVTCLRADGVTVADSSCNASTKPAAQQAATDYSMCTYSWSAAAWGSPSTTCGDATTMRAVTCASSDGRTVTDTFCTGTKPDLSKTSHETSGCGFSWKPDATWSTAVPACGATVQNRSVSCLRADGVTVADTSCDTATKPATQQAATDYSTCSYSWTSAAWGAPSTTCGDATSTRAITCVSSDGRTVADTSCSGVKPDASKASHETSGCSYSWVSDATWGSAVPACGSTVQNRSVSCLRADGTTVPDASCNAATKPATQQAATDYSTCTFGWAAGSYGAWSNSCGSATQTRTVTCQSSDGRTVPDANCSAAGVKPDVSQTSYQTTGCGYSWSSGTFGSPAAACGATTQSRTVTCLRSDGTTVADASCSAAGTKPPLTQPATDYSTCGYSWNPGTYGTPTSTCGAATQTRTVTCLRADGTTVADASCSAVGAKPTTTQSSYQTTGCGYSWSSGSFGSSVAACGASTQSRTVTCLRSDATTVADSFCGSAGAKPSLTQPSTDYSTCSFSWAVGTYGTPTSTCGSATQIRSVTCLRSDGTTVVDASCSSVGTKPDVSQSSYQTTGCGYSWSSGTFGSPAAACGATTQSRTVTCLRSDGTTVADASCSSAGTKPSLTQPATDYSTCGYSWNPGTYGTPSSTCGTAMQTRSVTCLRSDGTTVTDASCSSAGAKPTTTQSSYQTTGCGYSWSAAAWGASSSTCSAHATQTRAVSCVRSDGQTVDASLCPSGTQPAATQSVSDLSTCSNYYYSAGGWSDWSSHCSASATRTMPIGCFRSETNCLSTDQYYWADQGGGNCSKKIPDANCTNPASATQGYSPASGSQTAAVYDQCGFTWQSGAWGATATACGASTQTRTVYCQRSDGTTVADANCTAAKPATSQAATDYGSCTFAWNYSGWTTTAQTCGSTSQTRTVYCQRSDGTTVADGYCSATKPAAAQSYTDYSTCGYSWQSGAYSAQTNQCGTANQTRSVYCQRADGTTVADSYCSGTKPDTTVAYTNYNACTYYGGPWWGNYRYSSTCSATSQRSDDRTCYRSDGTAMTTGDPCIAAGVPVTETVTVANYTGCGYTWQASTFSVPAGCGSVTASRTVTCQRSDGSSVDGSSCVNAGQGAQPATTQTTSNYDSCSYSWYQSGYSAQTNQCGTAYQTQTVFCRRADGAQVDDSICGGGKPATSVAYTNYGSCTYTATYGAFGACANSTQSKGMTLCMRSDGTSVAGDYCVSAGQPWTISQACVSTASIPVSSSGTSLTACSGAKTGFESYSTDREKFLLSSATLAYTSGQTAIEKAGVQELVNYYPATTCVDYSVAVSGKAGAAVWGWQGYAGSYVNGSSLRNVVVTK